MNNEQHEWNLDVVPGYCTKCGRSYLYSSMAAEDPCPDQEILQPVPPKDTARLEALARAYARRNPINPDNPECPCSADGCPCDIFGYSEKDDWPEGFNGCLCTCGEVTSPQEHTQALGAAICVVANHELQPGGFPCDVCNSFATVILAQLEKSGYWIGS